MQDRKGDTDIKTVFWSMFQCCHSPQSSHPLPLPQSSKDCLMFRSLIHFFRMDWSDLLAVQGTLKSLLQHHSWKTSILWRSAFLIVQLSYPYMTAGKTIAVTTCFLGIHRVFKEEQDLCKNRCWVLTKYYSPCLFFMFMSVRGPCNFRNVIK